MKKFIEDWNKYANRDILKENSQPIDFSGFRINDELESNVWQNKRLNPQVRRKLIHIVKNFWQNLGLPTLEIDDITFTGSLANYNWSKYSDVDLHILVNFDNLPGEDEITQALMTSKRASWNKKHNIEIYGYEVEIYIQDSREIHHSTGVYSVLEDQWITEPEKKDFTIDKQNVKVKAHHIMKQIDKIEQSFRSGQYVETTQDVNRLKEKIRKFRKCGLEHAGEYSPENLAFKVLRRNGYLEKLSALKTSAYDKEMSIGRR